MIVIVTPSYNSAQFIEQTILSVAAQEGEFDLHYHIQDGASNDGTVEILEKWERWLNSGLFPVKCRSFTFSYASAPDAGMYHAIATAFDSIAIPEGSILSWINSDDLLFPSSIHTASKLFAAYPPNQLSWLGGIPCHMVKGHVSASRSSLCPYPREVIARGLCDGRHWNFIQQEGSFFRDWLWRKSEASQQLRQFKYAGDWNLWRVFAQHAGYVLYHHPLGIFRKHGNQLSALQRDAYLKEIESVIPSGERTSSLRAIPDEKLTYDFVDVDFDANFKFTGKSAAKAMQHFRKRMFSSLES